MRLRAFGCTQSLGLGAGRTRRFKAIVHATTAQWAGHRKNAKPKKHPVELFELFGVVYAGIILSRGSGGVGAQNHSNTWSKDRLEDSEPLRFPPSDIGRMFCKG